MNTREKGELRKLNYSFMIIEKNLKIFQYMPSINTKSRRDLLFKQISNSTKCGFDWSETVQWNYKQTEIQLVTSVWKEWNIDFWKLDSTAIWEVFADYGPELKTLVEINSVIWWQPELWSFVLQVWLQLLKGDGTLLRKQCTAQWSGKNKTHATEHDLNRSTNPGMSPQHCCFPFQLIHYYRRNSWNATTDTTFSTAKLGLLSCFQEISHKIWSFILRLVRVWRVWIINLFSLFINE